MNAAPSIALVKICAWCPEDAKRAIISANPNAKFTHGLCDECSTRLLAQHREIVRRKRGAELFRFNDGAVWLLFDPRLDHQGNEAIRQAFDAECERRARELGIDHCYGIERGRAPGDQPCNQALADEWAQKSKEVSA